MHALLHLHLHVRTGNEMHRERERRRVGGRDAGASLASHGIFHLLDGERESMRWCRSSKAEWKEEGKSVSASTQSLLLARTSCGGSLLFPRGWCAGRWPVIEEFTLPEREEELEDRVLFVANHLR